MEYKETGKYQGRGGSYYAAVAGQNTHFKAHTKKVAEKKITIKCV